MFAEEKEYIEGKRGKYLEEEDIFFEDEHQMMKRMMKRGCQDEGFAENILFVYWFSGHRR